VGPKRFGSKNIPELLQQSFCNMENASEELRLARSLLIFDVKLTDYATWLKRQCGSEKE
jgi:hypothetical protein